MKRRNRPRPSRPMGPPIARAAIAAAILLVASTWGRGTIAWIAGHDYFAVAETEVEGARALSADLVLETAGIEQGASLWAIDAAEARSRLRAHPRIRTAEVELETPGRVEIRIVERRPIVALLVPGDALYADAEGAVFPRLPSERLDALPVVTGFVPEDFARRPALTRVRLREVTDLLERWRVHTRWPSVSEIRVEGDAEWVVYSEGTPLSVRFARDDRDRQLSELATILEAWRDRERFLAAVDLTVPGQAILRLKDGAERLLRGRNQRI